MAETKSWLTNTEGAGPITRIKRILGHPTELTDEDIREAIKTAKGDYTLYKAVSKLSEKSLKNIDVNVWVDKYAIAVSKELLGNARRDNNLPYEHLFTEAQNSKGILVQMLCNENFEIIDQKDFRNKVIIVFYVAVGNLEDSEVPDYMNEIKSRISTLKDYHNVVEYFIPIREETSRIEIINVSGLPEESADEISGKLDIIKGLFEKIIKDGE